MDAADVRLNKYLEGKNRQIRRMCETVDLKLLALKRTKFGPITDNSLPEGKYRELTRKELEQLKSFAKKQTE